MSGGDVPSRLLIATIGLHASASTWVFNVVRELLMAHFGDREVAALYAEKLEELPAEPARSNQPLVIKSHYGSVELDAWLAANDAQCLVSVRDPRDASISMAQRFKAPFGAAVRWLENDCKRIMDLGSIATLLRYEDRFFGRKTTVDQLAMRLGIAVEPATVEAIFARYDTEAVRAFARALPNLPADRLAKVGESLMDRVTQIHQPHIGDTRSGKWRGLPPAVQTELTRRFAPFLERFGYV
jgi:hypothetical protein